MDTVSHSTFEDNSKKPRRVGKQIIICQDCQQTAVHMAHGFCSRCYHKHYQRERRKDPSHLEQGRTWSREYQRRRQQEDPAYYGRNAKLSRQRHPESARRGWDRWEEQNPEKVKESNAQYSRRFRENNRELVNKRARDYAKAHPEQMAIKAQKRRARMRDVSIDDFTLAQWRALKKAYDQRCAYCNKRSERLTQEHVIPITKGGNNTLSNIVPACKHCNSCKYTSIWIPLPPKFPEKLAKWQGKLSEPFDKRKFDKANQRRRGSMPQE